MSAELVELRKSERQRRATMDLIDFSCPLEELDQRVDELAQRLARIPLTQLVSKKRVVDRAFDDTGLRSPRTLGHIPDGARRDTVEERAFVGTAMEKGVKAAVIERDGPFGDCSQAAREEEPRKRSELGLPLL